MKSREHMLTMLSVKGVLFVVFFCLVFQWSCTVKRPLVKAGSEVRADVVPVPAAQLNKRDVDFQSEFSKVFKHNVDDLVYPELIRRFYERENYQPVLISRFLSDHSIEGFLGYLSQAGRHGLNPELFGLTAIQKQYDQYLGQGAVSGKEGYRNSMELELSVASALIKYSSVLQYGLADPAKICPHYSTLTLRPDSAAISHILQVQSLRKYLDSIQPKNRQYLALQRALNAEARTAMKSKEEVCMALVVNLERLRWKNQPSGQTLVRVNIAAFNLDVLNQGKSILQMKVCVGEKGEKETPQLNSMIYSVQVNPVWNIPQSIARNETTKNAAEDRYYLANNNINVYKKGKLIGDPESIDWSMADPDEYSFKQQPGEQNALGRIKFLFKNESSVYLHDTPLQSPFKKEMRAISHGCVRVEKPLELVLALFGQNDKYEQIKRAMSSGYPKAKFIGLPKPVPIWITYFTAWADQSGLIHLYKDVYQLDPLVYRTLL